MPKTRGPYPPEFRRQVVELVRAGRSVVEVAKEFEPSYWTIRQWVKQADRDECLNANLFFSIDDARNKLETWRLDYNTERPHSSWTIELLRSSSGAGNRRPPNTEF